MRVVILLLAAGASSRMRGGDKLLEEVDGRPLLRRQAEAALAALRATGGGEVLVALPVPEGRRGAALEGLAVRRVPVEAAALGMGHSIAAGARATRDPLIPRDAQDALGSRSARGTQGANAIRRLLVLPADLPDIGASEIALMLAASAALPDRVLRGTTQDGRPGHPVVFPARLLDPLAALTGDRGAASLLREEEVEPVPLPGSAALTDLDTPEDWAAWRAARAGCGVGG